MSNQKLKTGPKPRAGTASKAKIEIRSTTDEKKTWQELADKAGAKNVSAWIRQLVEQAQAQAA